MNSQILFLGKCFPKELLQKIVEESKGKVGYSNHNFEMSIIYGLSKHIKDLQVLTVPGVYSWPHNNRALFTKAERYEENGVFVKSAGFCNILLLNKISELFSTFINLLVCYRHLPTSKIHVITNAPSTFTLAALFISKIVSKKIIDITVIIPDIPSMVTMMHTEKTSVKTWLVGRLNALSLKMLERCDRHVLLSEAMTDFFKRDVPHIVMEGLIDERNYLGTLHKQNQNNKIVLYTGSIHRQFGIMNLVDAFEKAELADNVELWICGSGDAAEELKKRTVENGRIRFWGLVDSNRAREMQQQAAVLVNPRTSEFEFTKYSFPSKTLEYMMSGKPVVMNRLPGIPPEYFDYVVTPKDESVEQLATTLEFVMGLPEKERAQIGLRGRDFVLHNKNAVVQMKRVIDLIAENE